MQLTGFAFPYCLHALNQGLVDVDRILDAAPRTTADSFSPRRTAEALYRGGIILACSAWEAYLEDLALEALLRTMRAYAAGSAAGSRAQKIGARTTRLLETHDIDHSNWVDVVRRRDVLLGRFDTPKIANTNALFLRTLDIPNFASTWSWRRSTSKTVARQIDAFVALRGDIAHRKKGLCPLRKGIVSKYVALIEQVAVLSANRVRAWLVEGTGAQPKSWDELPLSR